MSRSSLEIMHYADYREFLQNYFHETKQKNPKWSYGSWAKKLGLKDTSSITKIIQGRREPGNKITEKLVSYFAFTGSEAQYFRNLIQLNKIKPNLKFVFIKPWKKKALKSETTGSSPLDLVSDEQFFPVHPDSGQTSGKVSRFFATYRVPRKTRVHIPRQD